MPNTNTRTAPFTKLFATDVLASSITAPLPTVTDPAVSSGFLDTTAGNIAAIVFYGTRTSSDNETFTARITGWRNIALLWIPVPLLALAITQGTSVGVAATDVVATEYFADTITASTSFTSAMEIISPADNTIAMVKVDPVGCRYVQVQLAKGTNATCNALGAVY